MAEDSEHPVVIVGGGPVGLACALGLARRGIACAVLEARSTVSAGSRAICLSRRTMQILDGLGVGARVAAHGIGWNTGRTFFRRHLVYRLDLPYDPADKHPPFVNLQQSALETYLIEAVEAHPAIDLRWSTTLLELHDRGDRVTLSVQGANGPSTLEAAYAVAADGARSTVRTALGLRLHGTSYEGLYLIADVRLASAHPIERRVWFDPPSNPGSTVIVHKQPDDLWRLDFQLVPGEDPETELAAPRLEARIARHLAYIGEEHPWTLEWSSLYRAHALTLDAYRYGRVLFAGDAAHLVPIFGVRGLNSGFEDAANLAWKLAAVIGGAADALLTSYSDERVESARRTIAEAAKSTWFMTPPSAGYRIMRDAVLELAVDHEFVRGLINPRQAAPSDYRESDLTITDCAADALPFAAPGTWFPDAPLAVSGTSRDSPRFLADCLGDDFTVVAFTYDQDAGPMNAIVEACASLPVSFVLVGTARAANASAALATVLVTPEVLHDFAGGEPCVSIVRPDGYVCARLRTGEFSRAATVVRTAGRLSTTAAVAP